MKTKSRLFVLLALLSLCAAKEPETVRIRLRCLAVNDPIEGVELWHKDAFSPLQIPSTVIGRELDYQGANPLTLFLRAETPDGSGPTHVPATQVRLPSDKRDCLLLIDRHAAAPDGQSLRVLPVDLATASFPPGAYRMMNHTGQPVAILFEEERLHLAPNEHRVFRPRSDERRPLSVRFAYAGPDAEASFVSTTWFHHPQHRDLVFLFAAPDGIRVKSVRLFADPAR